jgi:hypothetical protein
MSLPFPLYKRHKYLKRWDWERLGIIFLDDYHFEYIYNEYIRATNCDLCNKLFTKSRDRHLDHDHETGEIRNIVCNKCNCIRKDNKAYRNNTGEQNISKIKHKKYKTGYCFRIQIIRDGKYVLITKRKTLEEAIICRDEFIKNNPGIYT